LTIDGSSAMPPSPSRSTRICLAIIPENDLSRLAGLQEPIAIRSCRLEKALKRNIVEAEHLAAKIVAGLTNFDLDNQRVVSGGDPYEAIPPCIEPGAECPQHLLVSTEKRFAGLRR
jgi:hypothetical protein